jgi:hypothetical protein
MDVDRTMEARALADQMDDPMWVGRCSWFRPAPEEVGT